MPQKRALLINGLSLTLRNWPAFVWTYAFNLALALLFALPLHQQISAVTAHSLESQRLTGAFDLGVASGLFFKLSQGPGPAIAGSYFSTPIYLVLYFLIVPGTLFYYQANTPANLFQLLQSGFIYFWRFIRIALITVVVSVPTLAGLNALQKLWSDQVDESTVGRPAFLLELAGLILIALIAAALRLYFDLVQVYTVQLAQLQFPADFVKKGRPERQIRRTFKPAWHTFSRNFFRIYPAFLLLTLVGLAAVFLTARGAIHSLAQPRVWPIFLLAQLGLFLMLLTRFWQRGAETILALEHPMIAPIASPVSVNPPPAIAETPESALYQEQAIDPPMATASESPAEPEASPGHLPPSDL